eukprot:m.45901 g.45901  ORF g.45901 m.45901 type:complete len:88 (+) comp13110_c0_seq5:100-363(+)
MVYIKDWTEFCEAAEEMFQADPEKTRYLTKYRRRDKQFILKVTNNSKCLKYTGNFQHEVKRLDKFNHTMMQLMLGLSGDTKHKATET